MIRSIITVRRISSTTTFLALWVLAGSGSAADCNGNGLDDLADLASGTSLDCNANLVPDECDRAGAGLTFGTEFYPLESVRMAVADFDGDGDDDLAAGNGGARAVSVFENLGDGTLGDPVHYDLQDESVREVRAHDLDGDGDVDISVTLVGVTLIGDANGVAILRNHGDGTFAEAVMYPTEHSPRHTVAEDLDGDGDVDFTTANVLAGGLTVLSNRGDGTFETSTIPQVFAIPQEWDSTGEHIAVDLDNDGRKELAVLEGRRGQGPGGGLAVLRQAGDGSFSPPTSIELPAFPGSLAAGDLDSDGDLDLVVASRAVLTVLHNIGDGTLDAGTSYPSGTDSAVTHADVTVADLDADGDEDILTAGPTEASPKLGVALNRGDGTFDAVVLYHIDADPTEIRLADLTGDALPDVVLGHLNWPRITILENLGDGVLGEPTVRAAEPPHGSTWSVVPRDLDGDGDLDVVTSVSHGGIAVFRNASGEGLDVDCVEFVRGDANSDGIVSVSDMITVRRYVHDRQVALECLDAADVDDDEELDIADVAAGLDALFASPDWQEPPAAPFSEPGHDPTPLGPPDPDPGAPPRVPLGCDRYQPHPPEASDDLVRVGDVEAVPGEDVELPIYLTAAQSVEAMQLVFAYDPSTLSIESGDKSLSFEGSVYELFFGGSFTIVYNDGRSTSSFIYTDDRPWVSHLTVHPRAGVVTMAIAGHIVFDGFEVPPGEDMLICKVKATVRDDVQPGTVLSLEPTNGESGAGVGPFGLRNELTHEGDAQFLSFVPQTMSGFLNIVGDQSLFIRGDSNRDDVVDLSDAQRTLGHLFLGGARLPCRDAADANDDGRVDISDASFTLAFLFTGGPAPAAPYPDPGRDGTEDGLWCFALTR